MSVTCADFRPGIWEVSGEFVIDQTTGRKFENDSSDQIQENACLSAVAGIYTNPIFSILCVAGRTIRLIGCYHCWKESDQTQHRQIGGERVAKSTCMKDTGIDVLKCLGAPFLCVATQAMIWRACLCSSTRDMKKYIHALDIFQFDGALTGARYFHSKPELVTSPPAQQEMGTVLSITLTRAGTDVAVPLNNTASLQATSQGTNVNAETVIHR